MTTTFDEESVERLAAEGSEPPREEPLDEGAEPDAEGPEEAIELERPPIRIAVAVAFPVLAAGVMVGGVFTGSSGRVYACISGLLGVVVAMFAVRSRRPLTSNLVIFLGVFAIGLLMVVPAGLGKVVDVAGLASDARKAGDALRPPVPMTPGWQAIIGWLLGALGVVGTWVAVVLKRPALALLLPLPIAAIAGISVPDDQQVGSGLVVLVLFAVGLGALSSAQTVAEGEERPSLAFELRRAAKAIPLIAAITVALYALAQTNVLFPDQVYDPAQEPQKPKTVPLSEAPDRVLFEVESAVSGPWRIGSLDVYDGNDWRLPPFAESEFIDIPKSGVIDKEAAPGAVATFTTAGLTGTVLPGLSNITGVRARGPKLVYDDRNGSLRLAVGEVRPNLAYTVVSADLPSIPELQAITEDPPRPIRQFLRIPAPPPAVVGLLEGQCRKNTKWDTFDCLRNYILDNVTATGLGQPRAIAPERVQDMLSGSKEGSPFDIVAAQAMVARWAGVASRIGYGFDQGQKVGDKFEVRPTNGASFVEVYFPGYKWIPIIGVPRKAKPTVGSDPSQQNQVASIVPSDEIQVQLYLPTLVPPASVFVKQLQRTVLIALPIVLLILLIYVLYPWLLKSVLRSRRRHFADAAGPRARVALAYTEFRDHATDFGFSYPEDTPLMFLDRFAEDDEHSEFAWLVTRALWGDLQDRITPEIATAADELSRSLRRRLGAAQPFTVRVVALVSRLSLRKPYAPLLDLIVAARKEHAHGEPVGAHA